ncbi:DegT/DnrJ/EryC1/StrS family aminotransferase [Streptomyces sp. Go-475]|uniref:DegT/DnrJ/EryC1/StrS family aminotransferase n=1 Tax=Streptomyces sp. Go-475 TaxID=2072505 RepID=UPI000DF0A463|nr:DegT/DnrJ/EryC1/StrS family aminotransferase [Streptomyces sp. Go-475]AXE83686.1 dTDP-3-amino-3,6-dideoxy-alpha-D-galactopyranose transaminase [Streptomyces sp. Go-475]
MHDAFSGQRNGGLGMATSGAPRTPARTSAGVPAGSPAGTSRPVPFFTQARTFETLWPDIRSRLAEVFDDGKFSHGRQVARFEEALAQWTGARYAVGVNSGTDALVLLLRACGLRPGDEVVVPAFTFVASASAVVLAGGRPVFADIDPVTYTLDPKSAADAITPRTRVIMPVHLFCQLADMDPLLDLARRHGLTVVEDSAEAIGMRWDGVHAGLLGTGGVLSFFPTKTLGAIGDAGAILTDDPQLAETAGALRHHGRYGRTLAHFPGISNETTVNGVNSKMDDIQAAVLLAKLTRLHEDIARRALLAAAYTERLAGTPGVLRLPTVVPRTARTDPVFYVYLVEVERRDALAAYLTGHGVGTETYYPVPLHLQECFAPLGHRPGDFPHAEAACERTIALPLYPDMSLDDVDTVCDLVRRFATGRAA